MTPSRVGLFLDRDGTINTEVDFLRSPDELRLLPRAARAIREARSAGFSVAAITHQFGIAHEYMDERDLGRVHDRWRGLLAAAGSANDGMNYCPHHATTGPCRTAVLVTANHRATEQAECSERHFIVRIANGQFDAWTHICRRTTGDA